MAKMTERELLALVAAEERSALGFHSGDLTEQRSLAMDYYLAKPFGNEEEGRSQVISTDVSDTVEWMLPSLMRIFTSGNEVVVFEPVGPEDEQQAAQETDYINHLFWKELNGFWNMYSWFKDALIQKVGVIKFWWDDAEKSVRESYQGLNDIELAQLLEDDEVEALEHTERTDVIASAQDPFTGLETPIEGTVHDVTIKRTNRDGRMAMDVVPPEEFLISKDARGLSMEKARFIAHRSEKTVSELIEMGFPRALVEDLPSDTEESTEHTAERISRNNLTDDTHPNEMVDDSQRLVWVTEAYIRVDFNDDGVSELRQVIKAGNHVLSNEEVDSVPFAAITPVPLTHKFYGLSIADLVTDLQLIRSTILRQSLDNLYLSNNPEKLVNMDMVELEGINDLLSSRVGGIKRVRTGASPAQSAVAPLVVPFMGEASLSMMEYLEGVRRDRTGVGAEVQGLDPSVLQSSNANVVNNAFEAARMKLELIARIIAETGVKDLFRGIHELTQKHQQKERIISIRGQWIPVNPSEWKTRNNLTVTVGLGSGNREQNLLHLQTIWDKQREVIEGGGFGTLVTAENIYNTAVKFVQNAQLKQPELFFTDPRTVEPPPPAPDVNQQALELQAQIEAGKRQAEANRLQLQAEKERLDHEKDLQKLELERTRLESDQAKIIQDMQVQIAELEMKANDSAAKNEIEDKKIKLEILRMDLDERIEQLNAAIDLQKQELDASIERARIAGERLSEAAAKEREELTPKLQEIVNELRRISEKDESGKIREAIKEDLETALKTLRGRKKKVLRDAEGRVEQIIDVD